MASDSSDSRAVAWIAGLLVVIEPNFAYARVSGMEVPLLAFLISLVLWLLFKREYILAGLAMGLSVITRGEAAVVGIISGALFLLREYIQRKELSLITSKEFRFALKLFLPSIILGGAWAVFNLDASGHILPNTYFVKHNFALGVFNADNLYSIWMGYLRHSMLMYRWLTLATLPITIYGCFILIKNHGLQAVPWVIAPLIFIYAFSINIAVVPDQWNFMGRRYLDFIWPIVSVPFVLGAFNIWEAIKTRENRPLILFTPIIAIIIAATVVWRGVTLTKSLTTEYSWNCRNIEEVDVEMGKWINRNISPGETVGVTDAGAMRFFGEHEIIDLIGLNNHETIGRPIEELILEFKPGFVVLFRSDQIDAMPFLSEIHNIKTEHNTILGGSDLVVYQYIGEP
jgi:hypothetical protein